MRKNRFAAFILAITAAPSFFPPCALGNAPVAIIVNAKNPIAQLSKQETLNLFLRRTRSFPNGVRAVPRDQAPGTVKEVFYRDLFGYSLNDVENYWIRRLYRGEMGPPESRGSEDDAAMKRWIGENPAGIGYVSNGEGDGVKILTVAD